MKQRARDPKDKEMRRRSILDAAWQLFDEHAAQLPTVAQIAKAAGLAKGTIYLYFQSREEIYIELLKGQLSLWLTHTQTFAGDRSDLLAFAQHICAFPAEKPKLMRLACSSNSLLEYNISYDAAATYKSHLVQLLEDSGRSLEVQFGLGEGIGARLLLEAYALILGAWQVAVPPDLLKEVIEKENLSLLQIDFVEMASQMIFCYLQGALQQIKAGEQVGHSPPIS